MKKFLLSIFTLFLITTSLVYAKDDGPCDVLPEGMTAETCQAITQLFKNQVDGPWYNQNPTQFAKKITTAPADEIFGERYTFAQINWIINSIATMLNPASGIDSPAKLFEFIKAIKTTIDGLGTGKTPSFQDYAKLGPMGIFAGGISALYTNPPASGIGEVKYMATRLLDIGTGVQPVLAQGYGFTGLGGTSGSAVRALWTASRNMAYLIMTVLLIASGFLIMFRVKINPQTVVSLQTMIPKLIITMLLVTFSFAIAGLVIDLIYVVIAAFVGFMSLGGIMDNPSQLSNTIQWLTTPSFLKYVLLQAPLQIIVGIFIPLIVGGLLSFIPAIGIVAGLWGAVIAIIVMIWLIITFFKIFIMLIKSYVFIILQITIAPLQIMLDLIPGQQGFGPWFRNLIANASVFVVVPIMLFIQHVISWDPITNWTLHIKALGPVATGGLGGTNLNLPYYDLAGSLGQGSLGDLNFMTRWIMGFVIWSMTPKVAEMIRDALKIPPFKYGSAIGEAAHWITKPVGGVLQGAGTAIAKRTGASEIEVIAGSLIQNAGGSVSSFNTK